MGPLATLSPGLPDARLERLGLLVAGIAHEMNTPLQTVGHNVHYARDLVPRLRELVEAADAAVAPGASPQAREAYAVLRAECTQDDWLDDIGAALGDALEGTDRASALVRGMSEFAHPHPDAVADIDVARIVASLATLSRNEWKYVADLSLDVSPDLPRARGNEAAVSLKCLDLILAAAGAVKRAHAARPGWRGRIDVHAVLRGDHVEVRVWHNADAEGANATVAVPEPPATGDAACLRLPLTG